MIRDDTLLTCVHCARTAPAEWFDSWRACLGAPGLSGKVDIDRPECDWCLLDICAARKS